MKDEQVTSHCGKWCRGCDHVGDFDFRWFDFGEKTSLNERFYVVLDGGTRTTFTSFYKGSDESRAEDAYIKGQEVMARLRHKVPVSPAQEAANEVK